jgi:tetratricopeptide (TPR) repeat protein
MGMASSGRFVVWDGNLEEAMGLFKIFGGKSPEDLEARGDALFEAGECGRAKIEYESGLEKCRRKSPRDKALEGRLVEKSSRAREALAVQHKEEGIEILESEYDEAAEECFRLALSLTEDPELVRELEGLLDGIRSRRRRASPLPDPDEDLYEGSGDAGADAPGRGETFGALVSALPGPVRKAFSSYGEAFRDGYVALNEGDFRRAADRLSEALEENPEGDRILPELATAYLNLEMQTEAWDLAEAFLQAHPDDLQGYPVLCEVLWSLGEHDTALQRLDACPSPLDEALPILHLRGETLLRAGRTAEAEGLYEEALETRGFDPDVARALAGVYEMRGRKEEARDLYGRLLNECRTCAGPSDPAARQRYAELSFELGDRSPGVLQLFLSLAREHPEGRAGYYDRISRIYADQGNRAEAERFEGFALQAREEAEPVR